MSVRFAFPDQLAIIFGFSLSQSDHREEFVSVEARERSGPFFLFFHNGSYEHRVPKINNQTLFCTSYVCVGVCMCV